MRLAGKVAIVTGARRGIGRAIAIAIAKEGGDVVVNARHEASSVVKEIEGLGRKCLPIKADVSKKNEVEEMIRRILDSFGQIDILVNNAGVSSVSSVVDLEEGEWDRVMNVNAKGYFLCSQAVAKEMIKKKKGKIINISSIVSETGLRYMAHYCASKSAIVGLTKSLALELAPYNINVNAVCPGIALTDMVLEGWKYEAKLRGMDLENLEKERLSWIPLGRFEEPKDVAKLVIFLASSDANYITGQAMNVAGGMR